MDYKELKNNIDALAENAMRLENLYEENGGECSDETEALEEMEAELRRLLESDGMDLIGQWLKAKEDRKVSLKAEKDYITRQIAACDRSIDFIKAKAAEIMAALGKDKIKGERGYSFSAYTATKTTVNKDELNKEFKSKVDDALSGVLPNDVTVTLGASVSLIPEGEELPAYYDRTQAPSVKFGKPRANKA